MCVSNEGEKDEVSEHTPIRAAYKRSQETRFPASGSQALRIIASKSTRAWFGAGLVWLQWGPRGCLVLLPPRGTILGSSCYWSRSGTVRQLTQAQPLNSPTSTLPSCLIR